MTSTVGLVVDDDVDFLAEVTGFAGSTFRRVEIARTPLCALWILERVPIDVVLCDLNLHRQDCRHLLAHVAARWPRVRRILVSGFGGDLRRAPASAQHVLLKPFERAELEAALSLQ